MRPFMPTSLSPSSSIALKFSYDDHLISCADKKVFLLDPIQITSMVLLIANLYLKFHLDSDKSTPIMEKNKTLAP
jgi:hypothetical protein